MGENSAIAWTDHTYNPWRGCTKVGPGCDHCYAEARDRRYEGGAHWGAGAPRIRAAAPTRLAPVKWNKEAAKGGPRKVFSLSLGDVFDNEVDPEWRHALFLMIEGTPHLRWQLVTKRIGNADKMLPSYFPTGFEHVGIIATVVNQEEADRDVPKLLDLKARRGVTWVGLSIEPQLGPIDLTELYPDRNSENALHALAGIRANPDGTASFILRLDWVISGGESAQGGVPRPYDLAWARSLRDQCAAAGVAYFQKQLGARPIIIPEDRDCAYPLHLKDHRAGADPSEWPADLRVQNFPEALR